MIAQGRPGLALVAAVSVLLVGGTAGTTTALDPVDRALTVTLQGPGSVRIDPPGTVCTATCTEKLEIGTKVTLTAKARAGLVFVSWHGICEGADEICELSLDENTAVKAVFAAASARPPPPPPPAPPAPAPRPRSMPDETLLPKLNRALDGLRAANVAFNTPTTLQLGESTEIQLLLSIREPLERLKEQVTEIGEVEGAVVRVSDDMEARLTGFGFEIEAISAPRQLVVDSENTEWKWEIKATRTGTHRLHLTLTAFLDVGGERRARTVETFERTLVIRVTWYRRLSGFVDDNWQWLWSTLLVPVAVWVLQRRRRAAAPGGPDHN